MDATPDPLAIRLLPRHRVVDDRIAPTILYVANFVTEAEEAALLRQITEHTPKPKWTVLRNRRLINYGGIPHAKGMIREKIPPFLEPLIERAMQLGHLTAKHRINHLLINEYTPGQGIMMHADGDLFHPVVTTVSLGSHTVLRFRRCSEAADSDAVGIHLGRRSLVVVSDHMYTDFMHGIDEVTTDDADDATIIWPVTEAVHQQGDRWMERTTRISITMRHVPRVSNFVLR